VERPVQSSLAPYQGKCAPMLLISPPLSYSQRPPGVKHVLNSCSSCSADRRQLWFSVRENVEIIPKCTVHVDNVLVDPVTEYEPVGL
jgi:hypothetical protein